MLGWVNKWWVAWICKSTLFLKESLRVNSGKKNIKSRSSDSDCRNWYNPMGSKPLYWSDGVSMFRFVHKCLVCSLTWWMNLLDSIRAAGLGDHEHDDTTACPKWEGRAGGSGRCWEQEGRGPRWEVGGAGQGNKEGSIEHQKGSSVHRDLHKNRW